MHVRGQVAVGYGGRRVALQRRHTQCFRELSSRKRSWQPCSVLLKPQEVERTHDVISHESRLCTLLPPICRRSAAFPQNGAGAHTKAPVEVQKQFCLTLQPEAAGEGPNISRVPVTFNDLTFSMFCYQQHDIVSDSILSGGSWEASMGSMILETLAQACNKTGVPKEDAIFLDIGANIGWYSLILAAAGYPVISFEPMQANEHLFRRSICSNPELQQRLTYHTDMLSDAPHTNCTMFSDEGNVGDSTVSCDQQLHMAPGYHVREAGINMTTLDIALADKLHHPVFMVKMV